MIRTAAAARYSSCATKLVAAGAALLVPSSSVPALIGPDQVLVQKAQLQSPAYRSCRPRLVRATGIQRGNPSQALLVPGNINCIEAQYGGVLEVEVELCEGREASLRGIALERNGFANGRRWSSNPPVSYELTYGDGTRSIPQPLGRGFGRRNVSFPAQSVRSVSIQIPSRYTRGYDTYEQLCSIGFSMN